MDLIQLVSRCHEMLPRCYGEYLAWVDRLREHWVVSQEEYQFLFFDTKEVDLYEVCDTYAPASKVLQPA